jgi:hypothetical protein
MCIGPLKMMAQKLLQFLFFLVSFHQKIICSCYFWTRVRFLARFALSVWCDIDRGIWTSKKSHIFVMTWSCVVMLAGSLHFDVILVEGFGRSIILLFVLFL